MSIREKLILVLLVFAAVPMISMGYLGFANARKSLEEARIAGLESTADLKVEKIEAFFQHMTEDIESAQQLDAVQENLPILVSVAGDTTRPAYREAKEELDGDLVALQRTSGVTDVLLADVDGRVVYSSNEAHPSAHVGGLLPGPDGKAFEEGKEGVYLGEIFPTQVFLNQFAMVISAPVHGHGGSLVGVIAFQLDMDPLYDFVQETTGLGETGETLIARRTEGGALFLNPLRHDPGAALTRQAIFGEAQAVPIQEALQGRDGSGQSVDYRGEKVVAVWRSIPSVDWGLVAKIDTSEAFESVTNLRDLGLIAGGAILLASVLVAAAISRAFVRPIRALEEGARVVGSGNLDHRVGTTRKDEIGRLSRAFDQMTSDLKSVTASRDELDREVANRLRVEEELRESEETQRRSARESAVLAEIGRIVSSSLDIGVVYQQFADRVAELIPYDRTTIITVDLESGTLANAYQQGIDVPGRLRGTVTPLPGSQTEEVIHQRSAMLIQTEDRDELATRSPGLLPAFDAGLRSFLATPLISRDAAIGMMQLQSIKPDAYGETDVILAERMASQIAGAVANSELYAERSRAEEEREALIAALEGKNAELEQFAYTVSHDLKSPLITIKSFLGLLAQDADAGDAQRMRADMDRIAGAAEHMKELLDELLELSRVGHVVGPPEEMPLGDVAREAVALVAGQAAERDVQVTISAGLPLVYGDRHRVREVLQNLIENAIKFTGEQPSPRVEVGARHEDGETVCYVRDNGMGIASRYHGKVFGLFDQLDQTSEGMGLGLAFVKRIAEVHGGRVWVESEGLGHGSTFCFTLGSNGQGPTMTERRNER